MNTVFRNKENKIIAHFLGKTETVRAARVVDLEIIQEISPGYLARMAGSKGLNANFIQAKGDPIADVKVTRQPFAY